METMENKQIAASKENVANAINSIKEYAQEKGYQFIHVDDFSKKELIFDSKSKEKVCMSYLWRLENKMGMSTANRFLHFLYKKVYKLDQAPKVEYSEKELKIKEARKTWKKAQAEAERLLAEYKKEKGDFYKK